MNDDILTPRLCLTVATAALLRAEGDALATLAEWKALPNFVLEMMLTRADERDENGYLWPVFYVVERTENVLIGGINFKSLPRVGEVEIGYELARAVESRLCHRGRGCSVRAFARGILRICAGVEQGNLASARVLRKNGFERDGTDRNGRLRFPKS